MSEVRPILYFDLAKRSEKSPNMDKAKSFEHTELRHAESLGGRVLKRLMLLSDDSLVGR